MLLVQHGTRHQANSLHLKHTSKPTNQTTHNRRPARGRVRQPAARPLCVRPRAGRRHGHVPVPQVYDRARVDDGCVLLSVEVVCGGKVDVFVLGFALPGVLVCTCDGSTRLPTTHQPPSPRTDYGDPDEPEAFAYIRPYSPLHNVRPPADGKGQYPAMLLATGDHDDRCALVAAAVLCCCV